MESMMAEIVSFDSHRKKRAADRSLREWRFLFQSATDFDEHTRWADLPDEVILFFCEEGPRSRHSLHDLIMSSGRSGDGSDFETQACDRLVMLFNAYFFLTDQARFECMRRLGWLETIPRADNSIIAAVQDSGTYEYAALLETPEPTSAHPAYEEDRQSRGIYRAALVRKHSPQAIEQFKKRVAGASA
jgi:hypothetical protein